MRRAMLLLVLAALPAFGQDTSFSRVSIRAGVLRLPSIGRIGQDWDARTGFQGAIGSNVGAGELSLGVGHIGFDPTTGHPPFAETFFSLDWARPVARIGRTRLDVGARLSDVRMKFDDPAQIAGLNTEEEVLISVVGRGHLSLGHRFSGFLEATCGLQMLSTKTTIVGAAAGLQRDAAMPRWLRDFLR